MQARLLGLFFIVFWMVSCSHLEKKPEPFTHQIPSNLPPFAPFPDDNPTTKPGVLLGEKLFFDPVLSGNNKISCATCHQPERSFSDGLVFSNTGISGNKLKRHTPALINLVWQKSLFWDGGIKNLESLPVAPLTHEDEMGQDLKILGLELQKLNPYPSLFKDAFGTDSITTQNILKALAQYQRTLISGNSGYDQYVNGKAKFNPSELNGLRLFQQHCAGCHRPDLFTDAGYHNNGLDADFADYTDLRIRQGRYRITYKKEDLGKYKTPTLRNIALTAPYMHDGRFVDLGQVINHYSENIEDSPTLDSKIPKKGFQFAENEKKDLILFLQTLTDHDFVKTKK